MASTNPTLAKLLNSNIQWARAVNEADPDFFETSSKGQSPQVSLDLSSFFFDIGCRFSLGVPMLTTPRAWLLIGIVDYLFGFEGPRIGGYGIQAWRNFRPQEHRQVRLISGPLSHPRATDLCVDLQPSAPR